ncbi:isopeptide-forming domain-containing fimbrial protein [Bifidobacterium pluvialisilvae]|uniref:isopeptide-forming domain-containing fimbrial protein n=1 Tax=Bifidobacterium pluvialisilvae TaxID=2834436 RepID=UPI001F2BB4DC|nr:isopeptide-forming domain-containing fimbrial protein [Bifidobacterium pluvialisilvae]
MAIVPLSNAADEGYAPDAPSVQVTSGVTVSIYKDKNHTQKFDPDKDMAGVGQTFYGQISFDFSDAQKPTLSSPNRSYTFPKNISVKDVKSSTLYDGDGNVAGTWTIKDGVVSAHWNEDWLTDHPSEISSYVSFDFTLGEDAGGDGNKEHIVFPGGGGDITITIDKSEVSGDKDYKLNDDGTVTFTVTLKPQFAVKNMVVTDTMGSNFTFVPGTFQLDGKDVTATIDGQKATINLGDLDKAGKNGYQLTYKAKLTDAAKKTLAQGGKLDDAQNTAQWTWDGADKPGEADTTPNLSYKMINKKDGSGRADDIKWTVELNTGNLKADMGGYVFKDTIKDGQHYIGSYEVIKGTDWNNPVATGTLDGTARSFEYKFPQDAGRADVLHRVPYRARRRLLDRDGEQRRHRDPAGPGHAAGRRGLRQVHAEGHQHLRHQERRLLHRGHGRQGRVDVRCKVLAHGREHRPHERAVHRREA